VKVIFYKCANDLWRWYVVSRNGKTVAECSGAYTTLQNAQKGAEVARAALSDKKVRVIQR
jgi:uncharacterized protein YegP (UPF0339 family)